MRELIEKKVIINLEHGLHARPASNFVKLASSFNSKITLTKGDKSVNAKSIMGVMSLAAAKGTEVTISVDGEDEQRAITELEKSLTEDESS